MNQDLIQIIEGAPIEKANQELIKDGFLNLFEQAKEWKKKAEKLVVTSADQKKEMQEARTARLALKKIRVEADKKRKDLKADSIRYGKAVQGVYNVIEYLVVPIQNHLEEQEKFVERQQAAIKEKLRIERIGKVEKYAEFIPVNLDFANMIEQDFEKLLNAAKVQFQAAELKEKKTQLETFRRQEAIPVSDFIEDFETIVFSDLSKKEFNNLLLDASAAKKEYFEVQEKLRIENEKLRAEKERIEQERIEAENKLKEKLAAEKEKARKIEAERKEKERIEAERIEAERVKQERIEAARIERERKAKAAPDREKLNRFIIEIEYLSTQEVELKTKEAQEVATHARKTLINLASELRKRVIDL